VSCHCQHYNACYVVGNVQSSCIDKHVRLMACWPQRSIHVVSEAHEWRYGLIVLCFVFRHGYRSSLSWCCCGLHVCTSNNTVVPWNQMASVNNTMGISNSLLRKHIMLHIRGQAINCSGEQPVKGKAISDTPYVIIVVGAVVVDRRCFCDTNWKSYVYLNSRAYSYCTRLVYAATSACTLRAGLSSPGPGR
jgi:hypothetical protein